MNSIKYKWRHWIGSNLQLYCAVIWIAFCIIFNKAEEVGPYLYVSGKARRLFVDQILYAQVKTINIISDLVITWKGHVISYQVMSSSSPCYRPKFFILENVKNFASYKKGMVLKLFLCTHHERRPEHSEVFQCSGDPRSYFQRKIRNNSQVLHDHVKYLPRRLSRPQHSTATSRPTIQIQSNSRTLRSNMNSHTSSLVLSFHP